ncbi:MAG TPA: hypothetical protein DHU96_31005 [Actinobacteria bacterium]|nr:hypothetical protein [Actinomycetota bacterium]
MSAEARREQFVSAATEVMSANGLEHATTRAIAAAAGAPQGPSTPRRASSRRSATA